MFCSLYGEYLAPANIPPQLDALLLMKAGDHDREDFKRAVSCGKPALLINRLPAEPELAYLSVDHRKESELAVTYLLRSGCRDIVLAGNREDERTVALRSRGWEDAYRNAGLEVPYHLTVNAEDLLSCQEKVKEYIEKFANPYVAASKGFIDSVIEPKETRSLLLHALKLSVLKEEYRPAKKHGLPPF